jgi:DNA-binding Xre family transcriptional regulator
MTTEQMPGGANGRVEPLVGLDDCQEGFILEVTEEIWRVMLRKKITKKELAERIGCGKSHMTQLLNGGRNMTLRTLADIAAALNCTPKFKLKSNAN